MALWIKKGSLNALNTLDTDELNGLFMCDFEIPLLAECCR